MHALPSLLRSRNDELHCFIEVFDPPLVPHHDGPLSGLSFAVKGNIAVQGKALSLGLVEPAIHASSASAAMVQKLLDAGAQLVGSTNFDELCLSACGRSRAWGQVRNPRCANLSPLGSSAGSACAVAAGLVDFALGTDYGGSVRAPASACGVWGLKLAPIPEYTSGIALLSTELDCPGIIASQPEVLQRVLSVLCASAASPLLLTTLITPQAEAISSCHSPVRQAFASFLERLGPHYTLRAELSLELLQEIAHIRQVLAAFHTADLCARFKVAREPLPQSAKALLALRDKLLPADYARANQHLLKIREQVSSLLSPGCAILTPTLSGLVPEVGADADYVGLQSYLPIANVVCAAALSFPTTQNLAGRLPFSLQLVVPSSYQASALPLAMATNRQ